MSELTFKSAGVSARTIDQTGPTNIEPQGVPAGVIGTSVKGPAFVPTTVATGQDFTVQFGAPNNDHFNAPLAVNEWLANQQSATFTRVLGIGTGLRRDQGADNTVVGAGFVVGEELPQNSLGGALGSNPYANLGGPLGQTFFLAAFMSESFVTVGSSSIGSNYISKSFISSSGETVGQGLLYLRGVIMAPSGVFPTLSSSFAPSDAPASTLVADSTWGSTNRGSITGSVFLSNGRQEFVILLNGHKGTDVRYPNVITASFDVTAPNYFVNVMNTDPLKIEEAGHYVYAEYPIHSSQAVVTGSGIVLPDSGSSYLGGFEQIAVLTKGANGRNAGSPGQNFENFEDRFRHAFSPWIISQGFTPVSGTVLPAQGFVNLFRLHAKDAGQYPNNRIKFSIENITPGTDARPYGTFDLLVRDITDTDKTRNVLESFRGLSLDPSSDRYIAKAVGDTNTFYNFDAAETSQGIVTDGTYPSRSNFIRVEMSSQVESGQVSEDVLPFGFRGMDYVWPGNKTTIDVSNMYVSASSFATIGFNTYQPPIPMRDNIIVGASPNQSVDRGLYWGVQFTRKTNTAEPNSSTIQESSIASFAKYFPNFDRTVTVEGDRAFSANYRADYESSNLFSLSKIKVARNQTTDLVDTNQFVSWSYVRNGDITTSGAVRALVPSDLTDASVRQAAKFSFFMQGGFDGTNPFNYNESVMNNFAIQEEMTNANRGITNGPTVKAYSKALDLIADTTEVDIQLLAVPGIRHSVITDKALLVTEARFDALYLMDIDQYDSTNLVVSGTNAGQITSVNFTANAFRSRGINSSFGAAYFPDVNIRDNIAGAVRTVAPSVAVLGAFGLNDTIGHPWFAPAGFTRGALKNVTESAVNLNRNNLDALQTVNINPLASFANSQGVSVWGQKTLLATDSALERVNVRRLLIDVRRKVKRVSDRIVFEQNRAETLARFEQLVKPILKNIQDQAGVERFLVKIDTETTTQADIQNRTIRGKIYVQPTKTLEFLDVAFVLTNNG